MTDPDKKAPDDDPDDEFWNNPDNFRDPPGGMDATNLDQGSAYPIQTANPGQANPIFEMPPESLYQGVPQNYQLGPPNPNPVRPQNQTGTSQRSRFRPPPDAYLFTSDLYEPSQMQQNQRWTGPSQRQGQPLHPYAYDPNFAQQQGDPRPMRTQQHQRQSNWPYHVPENRSSQGNFSFDAPDDITCVDGGRFQTGQIGLRQQAPQNPQNYPPNINQQGRYDQPSSNYNQYSTAQSNPQNPQRQGQFQNPYPITQNQQYGTRLSFAPSDGAPNLPRFPQPVETHGPPKRLITEKEDGLLRRCFQKNRRPNINVIEQTAKELGVDKQIINNWFKEERKRVAEQELKEKRQFIEQRFDEEQGRNRQNQRLAQRPPKRHPSTELDFKRLRRRFNSDPNPNARAITQIFKDLGFDRDIIKTWFEEERGRVAEQKLVEERLRKQRFDEEEERYRQNQGLVQRSQERRNTNQQVPGPEPPQHHRQPLNPYQVENPADIVPNNGQQVLYQNPHETRRPSQPSIQNTESEWNVSQQGQPSPSNQPNPSITSSGNGSTPHRTVEDATRERLRARLSLNEEQRNGRQIPPKSYPKPKNKDNTTTKDSSKDEKNSESDETKETKNSKERK